MNEPAGAPAALEGSGNYEVIRTRLLEKARELRHSAELLNQRRQQLFGGRELALLSTDRIRTENNCIPRDVASIGGQLLFGFQVFIGLKSETRVEDVFSLHRFQKTEQGYDLGAVPFEGAGAFLADADFKKQFADVFRYEKDPRLLQLLRTDQRLLFVLQIGATLTDAKVFRFSIDALERVKFIDARGEEDVAPPRPHSFEWTLATRDRHVAGQFPHINVLDKLFVETIHGDLTIKVENNTQTGQGIYREPVDDPNQALDDAEIAYAEVGTLVLLKIRPFREERLRYLVFNSRTQHVLRVDSIGLSCVELPENHGILFPNGYYLQSGDYKLFDGENSDARFERWMPSPNGEDVLYVFYRPEAGEYILLPYNLIRKEIANPLRCNGYCLFPDGTMLLFRESPSREPSRVHPVQLWQTPFTTVEFAASAPTDGSYLAKVGNRDLVAALSEALALCRAAEHTPASRANYEDLIRGVQRLQDTHYWLGHEEAAGLLPALKQVASVADLIVDEYEKQREQQRRAREAVEQAAARQQALLDRTRPTDLGTVDAFLAALSDWKHQRGALITLKELTGMDVARVAELEAEAVERFDAISQACVAFFLQADAFAPLLARLDAVIERAEQVLKAFELLPLRDELASVFEGLTLLAETVSSLDIQDSTERTRILDGTSTAFAHQNRARAVVEGRLRELSTTEKRADFAVQFKLMGQSVVNALGLATTPEACDEKLAALLLQLEELEGRFGELDEFAPAIAEKREEVLDAVATRRQMLLEERQRRAGHISSAAERMLAGIARRASERKNLDELNAYFATDSMVHKVRALSRELAELGEGVHAEEVEAKLKACRQNAQRTLRDRTELFDGDSNLIRFGRFQFQVNTQALELSLVARDEMLYAHLSGTDYFEPVSQAGLEAYRDLWSQELASENAQVYRGEFLAVSMLRDAEGRAHQLSLERLALAHADNTLLEVVREWAAPRLDEGYERGVHDHDGALILQALLGVWQSAGLLKFSATARAAAWLYWAGLAKDEQESLRLTAKSAARLRARLGDARAFRELSANLTEPLLGARGSYRLPLTRETALFAAEYLVTEVGNEAVRFTSSLGAAELERRCLADWEARGALRDFEDDLRAFANDRAAQFGLVLNYLNAVESPATGLHFEVAARRVLDAKFEFEPSAALTHVEVTGLLGNHARIQARKLSFELSELLERVGRFSLEVVPRYRTYRKLRTEAADAARKQLRLEELAPRVLSSFVRNRLIDEVYLPLVGANLAKQLGAAGAGKRTDLMGLLLLVSPPGYGKTTLMEYVANRLGLIFVKVNGPALGALVHSVDPAEAPNATSRQEVERINLALRMGNNVMLYLDDIQHTHPELLQKFISLCDGQRKIEGVWNGQSRTYDLRGKRFCVVMAGNPYTETGARFQIPDMLANRADTYNLGDILAGQAEAFAQSYLENALTSNPTLAPLAGRDPRDLPKLLDLARGRDIPPTDFAHAYSASELEEIRQVFRHLFQIQSVLLRVNQEYIASASQDDQYRTEPPFKLQGSYRNMNKLAEKVVAAQTGEDIERLIDDHYQSESQTLTQGAEQNLLKLAELRSRATPEQVRRWTEIKAGFVAIRRMGGKADDPVARLTGSLLGLDTQLKGIRETLVRAVEINAAETNAAQTNAAQTNAAEANSQAVFLETALAGLSQALAPLARPKVEVELASPWQPALGELAHQQLALLAQAINALAARPALAPAPNGNEVTQELVELRAAIDQLSGIVAQGALANVREVEVALAAHSTSNLFCPVTSLDVCGPGGGLFIATYDRPPPLGTPMRVLIDFTGGGRCEVRGRVRYHQDELGEGAPAGYGVEFTHVEPEAAALIEAFARLRAPWVRDLE